MKISKKDQDPSQVHQDATALAELSKRRSRHFAVGTDILCLGRRGTIVRVLHCKCPANETALHIRWDDDSMSIIEPHALNRGKPNHGE